MLRAFASLVLFTACTPRTPLLLPGADAITLGVTRPTPPWEELTVVEGRDGEGCGRSGWLGEREAALARMVNVAFQAGADYVKLVAEQAPHWDESCGYDFRWHVRGVAYRTRP